MSGNLAVSTINGVDISVSPVATESKIIGINQTWQDVTGSRVAGTTYTNSTGKPIYVSVYGGGGTGGTISLTVNGIIIEQANSGYPGTNTDSISSIIPNGSTYSVSLTNWTIYKWFELR